MFASQPSSWESSAWIVGQNCSSRKTSTRALAFLLNASCLVLERFSHGSFLLYPNNRQSQNQINIFGKAADQIECFGKTGAAFEGNSVLPGAAVDFRPSWLLMHSFRPYWQPLKVRYFPLFSFPLPSIQSFKKWHTLSSVLDCFLPLALWRP